MDLVEQLRGVLPRPGRDAGRAAGMAIHELGEVVDLVDVAGMAAPERSAERFWSTRKMKEDPGRWQGEGKGHPVLGVRCRMVQVLFFEILWWPRWP